MKNFVNKEELKSKSQMMFRNSHNLLLKNWGTK